MDEYLVRCQAAARCRGGSISNVYVDVGEDRPQFDALYAAIVADRVGEVFGASLSSWGLTATGILGVMAAMFEHRVALTMVDLPVPNTPSAQVLATSIYMADLNHGREVVTAQRRAALAQAKAAGKVIGRPRLEFDIERARAMRDRGASLKAIAQELGASIGTVHRRLNEPHST